MQPGFYVGVLAGEAPGHLDATAGLGFAKKFCLGLPNELPLFIRSHLRGLQVVGVDEVGLPLFEAFVFGLNLGDRVATPLAVGPPDVGLGYFAFFIYFAG